jgi:hypothetical protein
VLRRFSESEKYWEGVDRLAVQHGIPGRATAALFDAIHGYRVRNSSYRAVMDDWDQPISNQVATNDLRAMVRAGLLEQKGIKRGTFYIAGVPLLELRDKVRSSRQRIDAAGIFDD